MLNKVSIDTASSQVLGALRAARNRIWRLLLTRTLLWLVNAGLGFSLVLFLIEKNIYLPAGLRIAALAFFAAVLLLLAAYRLTKAAAGFGNLLKVARACDKNFPEFKNRLESAVELCSMQGQGRGASLYSSELLQAAVAQAASLVGDRDSVRRMADRVSAAEKRKLSREKYLAAALAALFIVFGISDPHGFAGIFQKYYHPLMILEQERNFRISVHPGNITVLRGDTLEIKASGSIYRPQPMLIHFRQVGKGTETTAMQHVSTREYMFNFSGLENDLRYYLQQGSTFTDTFNIIVTNNPFVTELRLRHLYPAYTGLPPYETSRDKAIQALKGSRIVLTGKSSNVLRSTRLILDGDSLRRMPIFAGRAFTDTITCLHDGSYQIRLEDRWGLTNTDTMVYPITVIPDEYPRIALRFPEGEAQVDESMQQGLVFELSDDFGVSKVRLVYHKESALGVGSEEKSLTIARYRAPKTYQVGQYLWNLKELSLLPKESVIYRLVAVDNDNVSGPKSISTPEFRISFPSLQEIFERQQQSQEEIARQLEELEDQGLKLREEIKQISETLEREQQMDWEQGRQLDQALAQQQQMAQQLNELSEQLDQSIRQLDRDEMLSIDVVEKLQRVQELMNEVATQEMKNLMEQIQEAIDNLDQKSLTEAMEEFSFSQEQYLEKLDKTLSLLEKLKLEQQMDYLVNLSSELAQHTAALLDSTAACLGEPCPSAPGQPDSSLSPGRESIDTTGGQAPETSEVEEGKPKAEPSMADSSAGESQDLLSDQDKDSTALGSDKLVDEATKLDELTTELFDQISQTSEQMDQAGEKSLANKLADEASLESQEQFEKLWTEIGEKFSKGQLQKTLAPQRRVSNQTRQMQERMKKYRDQLRDKWKQEVAQAMERAFDDLAYLSARQEDIFLAVQAEPEINHPDVLRYADRQQEILLGLASVRQALLEAALDNFFISNRLLAYLQISIERGKQAFEELGAEKRRKKPVVETSKSALASINAAMLTLLNDARMMEQAESGMGFDQMMAQLEELAERQENLNQQMQGLSSMSMPSQGGTPLMAPQGRRSSLPGDLMNLIRQLAAEQKAIRDKIAELAKEMSGRKDLPGTSLEGMVKEADEVIEDMIKRGVSPETFKRQRRILDRLLDAQRSIQQRDTTRKRKSETAGEYRGEPPPALARELLERSLENNELKAILERWKASYPESFERLIRAYYELLNSKKIENRLD